MAQTKSQLLNPLNGNINVSGAVTSSVAVVGAAVTITGGGIEASVGVITAASFVGSGEGLTGVASTDNIQTATAANFLDNVRVVGFSTLGSSSAEALIVSGVSTFTGDATFSGNVSIGGTLTYEDVTNVDSVGIVTARIGIDVLAGGISAVGVVTATTFSGSGANLTNLPSGQLVGALPAIDGSQLTGIAAGGIGTFTGSSTGITTFLDLSNAQDHKLTLSGISTISCTGGAEGESHTVRIINSGITTVGFSSYFLFPSGNAPSLPTADGTINLVTFTVHRVGLAGTQLLAGSASNFS